MNLNAVEINTIVNSLKETITNGKIRKILFPRGLVALCLEIRTPSQNNYLTIACHKNICHIGMSPEKPAREPVPSSFIMLCRKHLEGTILSKCEQINSDRVVCLTFRGQEEYFLLCELTNQHGNIFLLNKDHTILGSLVQNKSCFRKLATGKKYTPLLKAPPKTNLENRFKDCQNPALEADLLFFKNIKDLDKAEILNQYSSLIKKIQKKLQRLITNLEKDFSKAQKAPDLEHKASILAANLYLVKKGDQKFIGKDFSGQPIEIELQSGLSPGQNMNSLFEKASKLKRAHSKISIRKNEAKESYDSIARLKQDIALEEMSLEQLQNKLKKDYPFLLAEKIISKPKKIKRLPYKRFAISNNCEARVGKSAADNDDLTLHYSKSFDMWLHVKEGTGSHVIIPMQKGKQPTPEALTDAAHLAAHFSAAKNQSIVYVSYTPKKYITKSKGMPPGAVKVGKEKIITLRLEPERLNKLLDAQIK